MDLLMLVWQRLFCTAGQSLGLVENWSQVDWNKVAYLQALGYTPWWVDPTPPSSQLSGSQSSLARSFFLPTFN